MNLQLAFSICLCFLLLTTQQGVALHALSHLSEDSPTHEEQEEQSANLSACNKCIGYAGLAGGLYSLPPVFYPPALTLQRQSYSNPTVSLEFVRHYVTRAPPAPV